MKYTILTGQNSLEENRFKTKAEFIDVLSRGAEIELMWKGVHFGIVPEGVGDEVCIYLWNQPETEQIFRDAKDALEYQVASDRLGDVNTQVTVIDRSF